MAKAGWGVVYRGEREDLGSFAAIKVLRDAWLSPARRSRFAGEQRLLAQLNHPSIARLYDADTLPDGTPWFAMEYVDGEPLTTYCRSRESSIPERLRLFREVCEAVRHAHRHLIIHRDLKPSNVLVTPEGAIKLLDFGISKRLEEADRPVHVTLTSLRMMTPAYAAPEQIRGGPVGQHTDVYALGVILHELLTGQPPFDFSNRTPGEVEALILEGTAVRPSWAAREGSARRRDWADLDVLCLTAMHKEPARRYGTVDALIRDVDHYLKDEPLEARPDSIRYRLGKFSRRHWRAVAATVAVAVVVVALVAFYTVRLATARNAALAEAARTQRIQQFMSNLFQGGDEVLSDWDRAVQPRQRLSGAPGLPACGTDPARRGRALHPKRYPRTT